MDRYLVRPSPSPKPPSTSEATYGASGPATSLRSPLESWRQGTGWPLTEVDREGGLLEGRVAAERMRAAAAREARAGMNSAATGPAGRMRLLPSALDEAATRIQSAWRGHLRRCQLLAKCAGLQSFLCRRGTRLLARESIGNYPSLLPPAQPRRRRAQSDAPLQPAAALQPATADQRLSALKRLHAGAWKEIIAEVDGNDPDVRQRTEGRELSSQQISKIVRAVREQRFVAGLDDDACLEAGFFGPNQHRIQLCSRIFYPPRGDLTMSDGPALKRPRPS